MVLGGALAGARVMTATSSIGFSLMQEGMSYTAELETPCVVVDVMRLGPGIGSGAQQGQTDYRLITKGGGSGGYRCISLAPHTVQEIIDLVQLAFHLADNYRIAVIVVTDFILGRMAELVELRALDFGPLPSKDWALVGKVKKGGKRDAHIVPMTRGMEGAVGFHMRLLEKYRRITESEVRYDTYETNDADLLIVAYGSSARVSREAMKRARANGLKVGLFRPITLWPFPEEPLREAALKAGKVLVVEDSPGELVEDVQFAVQGRVPLSLLGIWGRHVPSVSGLIHPERVLEEVEKLA